MAMALGASGWVNCSDVLWSVASDLKAYNYDYLIEFLAWHWFITTSQQRIKFTHASRRVEGAAHLKQFCNFWSLSHVSTIRTDRSGRSI
jgi:hypothetical protein